MCRRRNYVSILLFTVQDKKYIKMAGPLFANQLGSLINFAIDFGYLFRRGISSFVACVQYFQSEWKLFIVASLCVCVLPCNAVPPSNQAASQPL